MRSFSRDPTVTRQRLKPGTVRRVAGWALPYRRELITFMIATALDAVVTVAVPLLLGGLVTGIQHKDTQLVLVIAGVVAGLALFDALLSLVQRWYSARVGEGLIYDLRTTVFRHVQQQPIAFFTRAQTGSLVSRLNSDVIGA
ncbi:MAG: ABC transporter transmembrane domain-containing protein, partial [Actinomycetota bacterium]